MEIEKPEWLEQMEGILETLNEGVIVVDDCQHIVFTNAVFQEMTGFSAEAMFGETTANFYRSEESSFIEAQREKGQRLGHNRFEFVVPQKDGKRLPVIISARTLEDPDGRQFAVITFTDISDQKRAEEQLREANKLLEERQREIEEDLVSRRSRAAEPCPQVADLGRSPRRSLFPSRAHDRRRFRSR